MIVGDAIKMLQTYFKQDENIVMVWVIADSSDPLQKEHNWTESERDIFIKDMDNFLWETISEDTEFVAGEVEREGADNE